MRSLCIILLCTMLLQAEAAEKTPDTGAIKQQLSQTFPDCAYLGLTYHPSNPTKKHFGLCAHKHSEIRGIFAASACVVTLISPGSKDRNPYYAKDGHWGIPESCEPARLRNKILHKNTLKTQNPISKLKELQTQGWLFETIKNYGQVGQAIDSLLAK